MRPVAENLERVTACGYQRIGLFALPEEAKEIDLYRRFGEWYGHVFFVLQKS